MKNQIIIIGGGAAGFMAAVTIAKLQPLFQVIILEQSAQVLQKVRISGGGRCNVTNAVEIPSELVHNYPRGKKELLGPFHDFNTIDTVKWFKERGVELKTEKDMRVFPVTDSSQTIVDCFLNEANEYNVQIICNQKVNAINKLEDSFEIQTNKANWKADKIFIATGSSPFFWKILEGLGHSLIPHVPSLFTFNIDDTLIANLAGISFQKIQAKFSFQKKAIEGDMLITHWGLSGPLILKLSAFYARELHGLNYQSELFVNFINQTQNQCFEKLLEAKKESPKKKIVNTPLFELTARFWASCLENSEISKDIIWADVKNNHLQNLASILTNKKFLTKSKTTFKDEFVTAGGVDLKEIDMKTMESKLIKNIYFGGEVLNIDAVTGGFNFQSAWTTAMIAAKNIAQ